MSNNSWSVSGQNLNGHHITITDSDNIKITKAVPFNSLSERKLFELISSSDNVLKYLSKPSTKLIQLHTTLWEI
jgi:hypothetical protein